MCKMITKNAFLYVIYISHSIGLLHISSHKVHSMYKTQYMYYKLILLIQTLSQRGDKTRGSGDQAKITVSTYSSKPFQIARAVRSKTSFPSRKMRSQTRRTVSLGKHVENRVRNHCMVNTLVNGGSQLAAEKTYKRSMNARSRGSTSIPLDYLTKINDPLRDYYYPNNGDISKLTRNAIVGVILQVI